MFVSQSIGSEELDLGLAADLSAGRPALQGKRQVAKYRTAGDPRVRAIPCRSTTNSGADGHHTGRMAGTFASTLRVRTRANCRYMTGTTNSVSKVPKLMPPATTQPI
jgi:hypothetical protein